MHDRVAYTTGYERELLKCCSREQPLRDSIHCFGAIFARENMAVGVRGHLQCGWPTKVCTVLGASRASIQHDTAKCRSECQVKRFGVGGARRGPLYAALDRDRHPSAY